MTQIGDYTLIRYSNALEPTEVDRLVNAVDDPQQASLWTKIKQKHFKYYYILIQNNEVIRYDFQLEELSPKPGEVNFQTYDKLNGEIIGGDDLNSIYVLYNNDLTQESEQKKIVRYQLVL